MSKPRPTNETPKQAAIDDRLIDDVSQRLRAGKRVRRKLAGEGWLHIDRPLPFLCVYRRPVDDPDPGAAQLVKGEGSYLVSPPSEDGGVSQKLIGAVASVLTDRFGAMLLMEVWSGKRIADSRCGALGCRPLFRVFLPPGDAGRPAAAAMVRALRRVRILGNAAQVEIRSGVKPTPGGMPFLIEPDDARRRAILMLGLEIPPVYQDPAGTQIFPEVLRRLRRDISRVLEQTSFRFAHLQTSHRPEHYLRLGRRTVLKATLQADAELAAVGDEFNLLLGVTPVNAPEALEQFREAHYRKSPRFHYRLLPFNPDLLKRRLYAISLERVEDPALAELLREKRVELDRQITLLQDRNTPQFLYGSLQLFGEADENLLKIARQLLSRYSDVRASEQESGAKPEQIDATAFAHRARAEIARYRKMWPEMSAAVELRDDVPGLLVARDRLLVDQNLRVSAHRLDALIHHEVGTHLLTYCNAAAQPLQLLRSGLPGYDELQEGTAVLAEYLAGGLSAGRLRLLAARAIAVRRLVEGRTFAEVFAEMRDEVKLSTRVAFMATLRVFRGGGFTKDVLYLRGLLLLLKYLAADGDEELLFIGKVSVPALPIMQELRWREVLGKPPLRPLYLDAPGAAERLARLRKGADVRELFGQGGTL